MRSSRLDCQAHHPWLIAEHPFSTGREMIMNDKIRTRLSGVLYLSMFVLTPVSLAIGWIAWDFRTGAVSALIVFTICFLLASLLLATVEDLSWIAVGMPLSLGVIYTALPEFMMGPLDDAAVMCAGAIFTFVLWLKKQPDTPKWIILPLLFSGLYTLVGGLVPGPVDELLASVIGVGASIAVALKKRIGGDAPQELEVDDIIGGEFEVQPEHQAALVLEQSSREGTADAESGL